MKLQPYTIRLWGTDHTVTPYLVSQTFGDGKRFIGLAPMFYRPWFYVVRIDSRWSLDHEGEEPFIDHVDEVYEAIEQQFGLCCDEEDEYGDRAECDCDGYEVWPRVKDFSGGSEWFELDEADLKKLGLAREAA